MARALDLAVTPGVPFGPNPRVGCVLLAPDGTTLAEGHHAGAGTPHAEVDALSRACGRVHGATAVVSLEPCAHTGRTGPCVTALIDAGVSRVVYAQRDPNPVASGGAPVLRAAGVDVAGGLLDECAAYVNRAWAFGIEHHRPLVTWKFAATLDGRSAAADGTSRWISSPAARVDSHRLRAQCDTILVGTGTVLGDDPELTVRDDQNRPLPREHQLLRVVMGLRPVPEDRRIRNAEADTVVLATRDPAEVLAELFDRGRRHVFLEGGPTLAAAFVCAGLVDEVVGYVAPMMLGAGRSAVGDLGIDTIADALHLGVQEVAVLGSGADTNVRLTMAPQRPITQAEPAQRED
ncbi:MAG TPA: bifunctional diaminohydroxyphosphoribosylaminopyrimidine deaminase/5-amino-6-(5-phosphoribosylamino)uracil reductase RibD [Nocardioidaceae bacterium]|nr:bifunctional diaminohydroxyphosphoribosylaminopyrimidine deaminase/5-amino-6-(5-phosphoribosylamino)uracil reductase RibD [Nocardioidaceae bacterium]